MDYKELEQHHKKFSDLSQKLMHEYMEVCMRHFKDNPRMTMVVTLSMSVNIIMEMYMTAGNTMTQILPDLPDIFIRYMKPFEKIKESWGKVTPEEFIKLYGEEHSAQFNNVPEKIREDIKEIYRLDKENRKKRSKK